MRPVRLTMQAFGPFAGREVVDFRKAVDSGLFGIYGATGAGKSSIFNAMTFALFGETTKAGHERASLRSDHADPVTSTEVEFVFDLGERRYVVIRKPEQVRPKLRGQGEVKDAHDVNLFDASGMALEDIREGARGKILAERKVGTVNEAVVQLLGYGAEQFRKIVLLPQGQFEAFLSANTGERIGILRDLFDVSIYRRLADALKVSSDLVVADIKERRDLCERQLAAENFDGLTALATGIVDAGTKAQELSALEASCKDAFTAAQLALVEGKALAEKFVTASKSKSALSVLERQKPDIDALRTRANRADRARSLLAAEGAVNAAERDVVVAESKEATAAASAVEWEGKAKVARHKLEVELTRESEIGSLRSTITNLEIHKATVENSTGMVAAAKAAAMAEKLAAKELAEAENGLVDKNGERQTSEGALKLERDRQARRIELVAIIGALTSRQKAALSWELAASDLEKAKRKVTALTDERNAAASALSSAKAAFEDAQRALAAEQAVHLAATLKSGEPCPVCGSAEHPAPAGGQPRHVGLDQAFREAKSNLDGADATAREAEQALALATGSSREAERQFSIIEVPTAKSGSLSSEISENSAELNRLGPHVDTLVLEAALEAVGANIKELEIERDRLKSELGRMNASAQAATARLEATLASVPTALRTRTAIVAELDKSKAQLDLLVTAKASAETQERVCREGSLGAAKDLAAARDRLEEAKERRDVATREFVARLNVEGLSANEFLELKPKISEIEADRARVVAFDNQLAIARDSAMSAEEAICGLVAPDVNALEEGNVKANLAYLQAVRDKATADQNLIRLATLHKQIEDELKALSDKEIETGPLRALAKLLTSGNTFGVDLETFAIGSIFDRVLTSGNLRLGPMSVHRYRMEREVEAGGRGRRGLGIQILDMHTGKSRSTATLSGGESFIVALALALGLADVVESASGKVRLDSIFVDEGFGSLDAEDGAGTLEQVLGVLSSLVSASRSVGLISHVQMVQDAVPNGFYVRKTPSGSFVETREPV
jgi:exonuclease SbcC